MPTRPKRHISLKDLAKELNISISTVSRALKDHPNISKDVKDRVKALADEWEYKPNPLAMGLLRQNTRTLGVIVPDLVTHFFSSVISGIESYAREQGYYIIISSSYESFRKEKECIENLMNSRVEGLIVSLSNETSDYSHFQEIIRKGIPIVFFDRVCLEDKASTVTIDNFEATQKTIQHFIDTGRKKIAYISGPEYLNISKERKQGYLQGLEKNGITFKSEYFIPCVMDPESATEATKKLLSLKDPPDAIFGINDTVAFAAMKEIRVQGFKIPTDIAVAGFTDDYHATVVHPSLTSVTHPTIKMGECSARLLIEKIQGDAEIQQIKLNAELVVRGSSNCYF